MNFQSLLSRKKNYRWIPAIVFVIVGIQSGCGLFGTVPGRDNELTAEVYKVKTAVDQLIAGQESMRRIVEQNQQTSSDTMGTNHRLLSSTTEDIKEQLFNQDTDIQAIKKQLGDLQFEIERLNALMELRANQPSLVATPATPISAPPAGEAFFEDGRADFQLGLYASAIAKFQQALDAGFDSDEKEIMARFWKSESLFMQKDYDSATGAYGDLITSNPVHVLAWQSLERLAQISDRTGNTTAAIDFYEAIVNSNPNYQEIDRVKERLAELKSSPTPTPTPPPSSLR